MVATIGTVAREIMEAEALRIFDGLTSWQWGIIEEGVSAAILAHAQAQPTRAATALVVVTEAARRGLLALEQDEA